MFHVKHPLDKYFVKSGDRTLHRPPLKCIINPILRFLQFRNNNPYVIASICDKTNDGNFTFIRYEFTRVSIEKKRSKNG